LTSSRTFSGGEDLAYTLQARKRALVIGEVTGGGAHPVEPRVVTANVFVMLPWGESINPITGMNWEGVGVQPNVAVPAEQALERALELVRKRLAERNGLSKKGGGELAGARASGFGALRILGASDG
jgi:C-terminal processing protease CtpA/Prc